MQDRQTNYLALFLSYLKTLSIGPDPGIELLIYSLHSSSLPTKVD